MDRHGLAYISRDQKSWVSVDKQISFAVELVTNAAAGKSSGAAGGDVGAVPVYPTGLVNTWPNPANPSLNVSFSLAKAGFVELSVFNIRGQLVYSLLAEERGVGPHTVKWPGICSSGSPVSSGVYLVKMVAGGDSFSRQVTLLK